MSKIGTNIETWNSEKTESNRNKFDELIQVYKISEKEFLQYG